MIGLANVYTYAANGFIQQIRQDSPRAAGCLEQIQNEYGPYPAFLAAFALTVLRDRRNRPSFSAQHEALKTFTFYDEMQGTTEAIRLYKEAADYLLAD